MQAMTAENELMKSSPLASSMNVSVTTVPKYSTTNASTAKTILLATTWPPIFTGVTAAGWTSRNSSRCACRNSTSVRNILMPPPVEPVFAQ